MGRFRSGMGRFLEKSARNQEITETVHKGTLERHPCNPCVRGGGQSAGAHISAHTRGALCLSLGEWSRSRGPGRRREPAADTHVSAGVSHRGVCRFSLMCSRPVIVRASKKQALTFTHLPQSAHSDLYLVRRRCTGRFCISARKSFSGLSAAGAEPSQSHGPHVSKARAVAWYRPSAGAPGAFVPSAGKG